MSSQPKKAARGALPSQPPALEVYADGSGKSNDKRNHYVSLSALIAPPSAWDEFARSWHSVAAKYENTQWHSTCALGPEGRKQFSGWPRSRRLSFRAALQNECFNRVANRTGFVHANCTVDLYAYRDASARIPSLLATSPERMCIEWIFAVGLGLLAESDVSGGNGEADWISFCFDRENFVPTIYQEWTRLSNQGHAMIARTSLIRPEDVVARLAVMKVGLQAADFLCWHSVRRNVGITTARRKYHDHDAAMICLTDCNPVLQFWDYDALVSQFGDP